MLAQLAQSVATEWEREKTIANFGAYPGWPEGTVNTEHILENLGHPLT